jgi:hypothetical protein
MAASPIPRSLAHDYERYVEQEVERYKESIPRGKLLAIGDEAVRQLGEAPQLALTEVVLVEEVDRIIRKRLRLPSYRVWAQRRMKALAQLRRPEHWGLHPDAPIVRALADTTDAHVLVAGTRDERTALYLAAHGCLVTAVHDQAEIVERVVDAAERAGIEQYVRGFVGLPGAWHASIPLAGVVYDTCALSDLGGPERAEILASWQHATRDGGVHLIESHDAWADDLRRWYDGWSVTLETSPDARAVMLARKFAT